MKEYRVVLAFCKNSNAYCLELVSPNRHRYVIARWAKKPTDKQVRDARKIAKAVVLALKIESRRGMEPLYIDYKFYLN